MKFHDQLTPSDCLRTCIGCLLDLHPDKVPDFCGEEGWDEIMAEAGGFQRWWLVLQGWLGERGYWFLEMRLDEATVWQPLPVEVYAILVGFTPNDVPHMIIGKCFGSQFKPVHDPHPSKPGITKVRGLGLIIPVDPVVQVRMGEKLESIEKLADTIGQRKPHPLVAAIWVNAREGLNKPTIAG